jgi:hypothetical protein
MAALYTIEENHNNHHQQGEARMITPDTSKSWYYMQSGNQLGPISFDELKAIADSGTIDRRKDLLWCDGMSDWVPAGEVEGIFTGPPPAPAVSEQGPQMQDSDEAFTTLRQDMQKSAIEAREAASGLMVLLILATGASLPLYMFDITANILMNHVSADFALNNFSQAANIISFVVLPLILAFLISILIQPVLANISVFRFTPKQKNAYQQLADDQKTLIDQSIIESNGGTFCQVSNEVGTLNFDFSIGKIAFSIAVVCIIAILVFYSR